MKKYIFHIDANSAYLSWQAVYDLQHGNAIDLRNISAAIGGDKSKRKGIILAKSLKAKQAGVKTGQPLFEALKVCPELTIVSPNYQLYMKCSDEMTAIIQTFSKKVERFSVDECFMELSCENPIVIAYQIKEYIHKTLGFTVNIGISTNKLLAKMGSELEKPDKIHTMFKEEIMEKMWPLPVNELFMVGRATYKKLTKYGINTIGQLANSDIDFLNQIMKSHGRLIWHYANGLDSSPVKKDNRKIKGIGNSTTTPFDVDDIRYASLFILSLTEMVAIRLRANNMMCHVVHVSYHRASKGGGQGRQRKLITPTDQTNTIYQTALELFKEIWDEGPVRHFGVRVTMLNTANIYQRSIFDEKNLEKKRRLNQNIDLLRVKYGSQTIKRASFIASGINNVNGGVHDNYPMMTSLL
ncbi:MAG: DNA polymerase IV [Clostridiales bacterium]|nr:DNA polymerase IV [Clostridiales bacterium]